jgi:hypothetical protein
MPGHLNPVVPGFVIKPGDWKYSSATTFTGLKGLIELNFTFYYNAQADACAIVREIHFDVQLNNIAAACVKIIFIPVDTIKFT